MPINALINEFKKHYETSSQMELDGNDRLENTHTDFLAWLISPTGEVLNNAGDIKPDNYDHGLGKVPLCTFLNLNGLLAEGVARRNKVWTIEELKKFKITVTTEKYLDDESRLDLLIIGAHENDTNKDFIIALEAKIGSKEHHNALDGEEQNGHYQSERYHRLVNEYAYPIKIYFFLTAPDSDGPVSPNFEHITFQDISTEIIANLISINDKRILEYRRCLSITKSFAIDELQSPILGIDQQELNNINRFLIDLCNCHNDWSNNNKQSTKDFKTHENFILAIARARRIATKFNDGEFKNINSYFNPDNVNIEREFYLKKEMGDGNKTFYCKILERINNVQPKKKVVDRLKGMRAQQIMYNKLNPDNQFDVIPEINTNMHAMNGEHYKWSAFQGELSADYNSLTYKDNNFKEPQWWLYWYIHAKIVQLDIKIGGSEFPKLNKNGQPRVGNEHNTQKWAFARALYGEMLPIVGEIPSGRVIFNTPGMKLTENHNGFEWNMDNRKILDIEGSAKFRFNQNGLLHDATIEFTPDLDGVNDDQIMFNALKMLHELYRNIMRDLGYLTNN